MWLIEFKGIKALAHQFATWELEALKANWLPIENWQYCQVWQFWQFWQIGLKQNFIIGYFMEIKNSNLSYICEY